MAAVAARYARALADVVADPKASAGAVRPEAPVPEGLGEAVRVQLRSFLEVLGGSDELRNVLSNPAVPAPKKRAIVERLGQVLGLSRITVNFLFVLADHRRTGMLAEIVESFEGMLDERQGVVRAEVTTAAELAPPERALLESALRKLTGKTVRAEFGVDDALIGGAHTRIGSTIYDGSVREQLRQIRERIESLSH